MNIGEPQRELEIVPVTLPVPEELPVEEPAGVPEPAGEPADVPDAVPVG